MPEPEDVAESTPPPGIDLEAVGRFLDIAGLRAELIAGGRSNLTYRIWNDDVEWVLRRPPLGHVLPTAHDMAREYRVITALRDTDVPVPRTLVLCEDQDVNGAPFYVMELMRGVIVRGQPPPGYADSAEEHRRMSDALIDTLVKIHQVDYKAVGLEGFGRPEGYLERQVRRWSKQWEGNMTRELPSIDELRSFLEKRLPQQSESRIVHGDYRLDNTMLALDDPGRVVAVLDWEMSTLGDPLADVGLLLVYWRREAERAGPGQGSPTGFPGRDEVIERYARQSGRAVDDLGFHVALGYYKLAIITEGIHARFLKGQTVGEGFDSIGAAVPMLVEMGLEAIRGG
jgi:aminoglycoside phosphotransferase (APT) family kinase protein